MNSKVPTEVRKRHEKLKQTIDHHRYLYHVLDRQEISEAALDSLKHELVALEKEYPELITPDSPSRRIGGQPLPEFIKVPHKVPQWSFNDAFSEEEMRDFDARVKRMLSPLIPLKKWGAESARRGLSQPSPDKNRSAPFAKGDSSRVGVVPTYTLEHKIDGLKVVLEYEKGILKTAATRGDGVVGEDVTHNVRTIESVPLQLREPVSVIVEGEVWMRKTQLQTLNRERKKQGLELFANPRNVAAGSIRQLDPSIVASRRLESFIYDLSFVCNSPFSKGSTPSSAGGISMPSTQYEELEYLQELGFKVNPHFEHAQTIDDVIVYWKKWQK